MNIGVSNAILVFTKYVSGKGNATNIHYRPTHSTVRKRQTQ